jgi:hypothetical protein
VADKIKYCATYYNSFPLWGVRPFCHALTFPSRGTSSLGWEETFWRCQGRTWYHRKKHVNLKTSYQILTFEVTEVTTVVAERKSTRFIACCTTFLLYPNTQVKIRSNLHVYYFWIVRSLSKKEVQQELCFYNSLSTLSLSYEGKYQLSSFHSQTAACALLWQ